MTASFPLWRSRWRRCLQEVRALRESGESISELVRSYGVSRATIYRALRNGDIPVGPSGPTVVTEPEALVGAGR